MSPRRLVAAVATGVAVVVLAFSVLSGADAAEPRAAARTSGVAQQLVAPAAQPMLGAGPQAARPSPSASPSPKQAGSAAVVPARPPRVPNRFVIYAVYLLALAAVGLVVLWAAVGWHERPPRIDPREPA